MVVYREGTPVTLCDRCYAVIRGTHVRAHMGDMLTPAHYHIDCAPQSLKAPVVERPAA